MTTEEFDVPNGKCRACGANLNEHLMPRPQPQLYDVQNDVMKFATQDEVTALQRAAERGALQRQVVQNVLTMDVSGLRELVRWLKRSVVEARSGDD